MDAEGGLGKADVRLRAKTSAVSPPWNPNIWISGEPAAQVQSVIGIIEGSRVSYWMGRLNAVFKVNALICSDRNVPRRADLQPRPDRSKERRCPWP